jgi:hypothetical protein
MFRTPSMTSFLASHGLSALRHPSSRHERTPGNPLTISFAALSISAFTGTPGRQHDTKRDVAAVDLEVSDKTERDDVFV